MSILLHWETEVKDHKLTFSQRFFKKKFTNKNKLLSYSNPRETQAKEQSPSRDSFYVSSYTGNRVTFVDPKSASTGDHLLQLNKDWPHTNAKNVCNYIRKLI